MQQYFKMVNQTRIVKEISVQWRKLKYDIDALNLQIPELDRLISIISVL